MRRTSFFLAAVVLGISACGDPLSGQSLQTLPTQEEPARMVATDLFAELTERDTSPGADGEAVSGVVEGVNDLAVRFFQTAAGEPTDNFVIGNYSLSTVLFLTMAGTGGQTTDQFAELLGVESVDRTELHQAVNAVDLILTSRAGQDLDLSKANKLFVQEGLDLRHEFLDIAVASYGAPVTAVDFAGPGDHVAKIVNDWVAKQTDGFIDKLTDGYSPETVVVLANAMYLKAPWSVRFERVDDPVEFTTSEGNVVAAETMRHDEYLPINQEPNLMAVELPYEGGNLSLVVIQPADLAEFEASLTATRLAEITDGLEESGVHFSMPIFSTKTSVEALDHLHQLGMPEQYDFSTMLDDGHSGYFIDSISHVARIEVDETGTTAAASSDVAIAASHGPTVDINKPFFYLIRERGSGVILFMGHVTDHTLTD